MSSWVDVLGDADGVDRWERAKAFHHGAALPGAVLRELLDDLVHGASGDRRAVAAWTLGFATIRHRHLELVVDRLADVGLDPAAPADVRSHAVEAIAHQLQRTSQLRLRRRAARRLDALVTDTDTDVRYRTAFALGQLDVAPASRSLRRLLADHELRVRDEATDALGSVTCDRRR